MFNVQRKIPYLLKNEVTEIYLSHSLRTFAVSTISVFLPLYLLSKGYSLLQSFGFFLVQSIVVLITIHWFVNYAAKKGFKRSIMISIPLTILFFYSLISIEQLSQLIGPNLSLVTTAILGIIANSFYWMGFHLDFAQSHTTGKATKQLSVLHAISILFSVIGPLLGAIIIINQGYNALFTLIIAVFTCSAIPLFFTKDLHEPVSADLNHIFSRSERTKHYPYVGEGFRQMAAVIFWPVLLYYLAINLTTIGGLFTFTNAVLVIVTLYVGRITTEKNKRRLLNIGVAIHSFTLAVRTLLQTVTFIALAQGMGAVSFSLFRTPYESIHYTKSRKQGIVHTVFAREIYLHLGNVASIASFAIAYALSKNAISALTITIILGAASSFLMTKIREE